MILPAHLPYHKHTAIVADSEPNCACFLRGAVVERLKWFSSNCP
jgi:hypothetical protein